MKRLRIIKTKVLAKVTLWLSAHESDLDKYRNVKGKLDFGMIAAELGLNPAFHRSQQIQLLFAPVLWKREGPFRKLGLGEIAKEGETCKMASTRAPGGQISLNISAVGVIVNRTPTIQEIESMVHDEEKHTVAHIWNELMLQETDGRLSFFIPVRTARGTERTPIVHRTLARSLLKAPGKAPEARLSRPRHYEMGNKGPMSSDEQVALSAFLLSDVETQKNYLIQHTPTTFRELTPWVEAGAQISFWDCRPSAVGINDPELWIRHLTGCIFSPERHWRISNRSFLFSLALRLRNSGHVLWPSSVVAAMGRAAGGRNDRNAVLHLLERNLKQVSEQRFPTIAMVVGSLPDRAAAQCRTKINQLLLCTDLADERHISRVFAGHRKIRRLARGAVATIGAWSIVLDKLVIANDPLALQAAAPHKNRFTTWISESLGKRDEPEAAEWTKLFLRYHDEVIVPHNVKRHNRRIYVLRTLVDWFTKNADLHGRMLGPLEITRDLAWPSVAMEGSFKEHVVQAFSGVSNREKYQNHAVGAARGFFAFVHDNNPKFRNPIFSTDRFRGTTRTKTLRLRVPSTTLHSIRDSIITKTETKGEVIPVGWSAFVQSIPNFHEQVLVQSQLREIFCPVFPAIFWLAAQWPLRQSQITWLDSGELDEFVYDFSSRDFVRNSSHGAIRRREAGVIAKVEADTGIGDSFGHNHAVDFRVQRNKRLISERSEYTIPYMDSITLWVIQEVLDWHRQYGIPPRLVKESDNDNDIRPWTGEPEFAPLFRLPRNQGIFPPSTMQLGKAWYAFCQAYDRRDGISEADKLTAADLHNRLAHLRDRFVPKYDLHNLRVGGISDLLDRGFPLALVAAIAGHRSISMTLYYYKIDRQQMRLRLSEALRANPRLAQLAGDIYRLLQAGDENLLTQLMGNIAVLKTAIGGNHPISISSRGICPGTRCEDGLKSSNAGVGSWGTLVPNTLCPLCQFWITGTMFLPGLVKWLNELLEELEIAAQKQASLFDEMTKLDAAGNSQEARQLRSEQEYLERSCVPKGAAVARLYEVITQLCKRWETTSPNGADSALLAPNAVSMHPRLECIGRFEKIHEMQVLDHILPNQTSEVGRRVTAEHTLELMRILEKYGASQFYLGLPPELHRSANIALGDLMMKIVPSTEDLEAVYTRKKLFTDVIAGQTDDEIEASLKSIGASLRMPHLSRNTGLLISNN